MCILSCVHRVWAMHWTVKTEYISHCHAGFFPRVSDHLLFTVYAFPSFGHSYTASVIHQNVQVWANYYLSIQMHCTLCLKISLLSLVIRADLDNFWHRCSCVSKQSEDLFPPHLTSASVLPGKIANPEIESFHLNAACCFTKKHKTH